MTLILAAAVLHALWNAIVKGSMDRGVSIGLVATGSSLFGWMLVPFVDTPHPDSWLFIALTVAIHLFYFMFLILAYRLGDFSQMYPIARGISPVLVTLGAMVLVGDHLTMTGWAGLLVISGAIAVVVIARGGVPNDPVAIMAAIMTGLCIAAYTIVDGMGVRLSGAPTGYIAWAFGSKIILGIGFLIWRRGAIFNISAGTFAAGIAGGLISGLAYAMAVYAMSLTTLASVSAIRESSVIIAALIGVLWFGERPWLPRVVAAVFVVGGVILITAG